LPEFTPLEQVLAVQRQHRGVSLRPTPYCERFLVQPMSLDVCTRLVKVRRARTREVPQRGRVPPQVIVDPEALVVRRERAQVTQERKVLARILRSVR
jgi:hypothetical protein